jgi:hypothetical protein
MSTPEKTCTKCKQPRPLTEFGKDRHNKDGLHSQCNACRSLYRGEHKVEAVVYNKAYRFKHKIEIAVQRKAYRDTHKVETAAYKKTYYTEHKEERAVYHKAWYTKHQVKVVANSKTCVSTLSGYLRSRWYNMKARCTNPKNIGYDQYGGAGVQCLFTFESFFNHVTKDLGFTSVDMLKDLDVHRVNDGNYCVGGIEFLTRDDHAAAHKILRQVNIRQEKPPR